MNVAEEVCQRLSGGGRGAEVVDADVWELFHPALKGRHGRRCLGTQFEGGMAVGDRGLGDTFGM